MEHDVVAHGSKHGGVSLRVAAHLLSLGALILAAGCVRTPARAVVRLVDYAATGDTRRYREPFDEAYYRLDDQGNLDLVLRSAVSAANEPGTGVAQVVYVRSLWRPVPGKTVAHGTQLNGTVSYFLTKGRVGTAYDGAGSVFFRRKRNGVLTGTIDLAHLRASRLRGIKHPLLRLPELSASFRAVEDTSRVIRIINEMNRVFGPPPPPQLPIPIPSSN